MRTISAFTLDLKQLLVAQIWDFAGKSEGIVSFDGKSRGIRLTLQEWQMMSLKSYHSVIHK